MAPHVKIKLNSCTVHEVHCVPSSRTIGRRLAHPKTIPAVSSVCEMPTQLQNFGCARNVLWRWSSPGVSPFDSPFVGSSTAVIAFVVLVLRLFECVNQLAASVLVADVLVADSVVSPCRRPAVSPPDLLSRQMNKSPLPKPEAK